MPDPETTRGRHTQSINGELALALQIIMIRAGRASKCDSDLGISTRTYSAKRTEGSDENKTSDQRYLSHTEILQTNESKTTVDRSRNYPIMLSSYNTINLRGSSPHRGKSRRQYGRARMSWAADGA